MAGVPKFSQNYSSLGNLDRRGKVCVYTRWPLALKGKQAQELFSTCDGFSGKLLVGESWPLESSAEFSPRKGRELAGLIGE